MEFLIDLSVLDVIVVVSLPVMVIIIIVLYVREGRATRKTLDSAYRLTAEFEALRQKVKQRETS